MIPTVHSRQVVEYLCLVFQEMNIQMHEESSSITRKLLSPDGISITAITWNLFGSLPPANSLFQLSSSSFFNPKPHLIFFGTQECERDLWMTMCCQGKSAWQDMLRQTFPDYQLKFTEVMRGLHTACLVLKKHKDQAQIYRQNKLKTGANGCMGTKGAISTVVLFMGELIQFINCHLPSGQEESQQRNNTINDILNNIVEKQTRCDVIFGGDFNYRIDITHQQYEEMFQGKAENSDKSVRYSQLLPKDQLRRQKRLRDTFLEDYKEACITFPPTYKLSIENDEYSKKRVPGWTDRIFHKSSQTMKILDYDCEYQARGSDHRPVLARFSKEIVGPSFHLAKNNEGSCQLI